MKCSNIRVVEGQLAFDCPHCGFSYDADDNLISQVWADYNGVIPCQQESCGQEILFPTLEESQALMGGESAPQQIEGAPASTAGEGLTAEVVEQTSAAADAVAHVAAEAVTTNLAVAEAEKEEVEEAVMLPRAKAATPATAPANPAAKPDAISFGFRGAKNLDSLDKAAKKSVQLAVKTILREECRRDDQNTFDQVVTDFLQQVGTENVTGVHPVSHTAKDGKAQDFGVLIVYRIL